MILLEKRKKISFVLKKIAYNKNKRILHSGSALAFQARGAGSIPAIRSSSKSFLLKKYFFYKLETYFFLAGVAKWSRQWIVTPPLAGSTPVIRPF